MNLNLKFKKSFIHFLSCSFAIILLSGKAMAEVGPGGHYFGCAHTLRRYQTAFYAPLLSDWSNFGQWTDSGAKTATERANGLWKQILADFEPPDIDSARMEALDDFIARRTAAGGAPPES